MKLTFVCVKLPDLLPDGLATPPSRKTSLGIPVTTLAFAMALFTSLQRYTTMDTNSYRPL